MLIKALHLIIVGLLLSAAMAAQVDTHSISIEYLQFTSPEAKQSYYLALDNEFAGLDANRH